MFKTNLKNMFTALCCTLTMYLICQLLLTYLVEKPTTTSEQKKDLELSDLPEVVVCLEPGLNSSSLEENGYHPTMYWRGVLQLDGEDFVGWSGGIGGNKSSHEILQEALLISDDQYFNKTKLIRFNGYSSHDFDAKMSNYNLRALIYPFARCISFDPSSQKKKMSTTPNYVFIGFNNSVFASSNISFESLRIFFMDKANSPRIYPDRMAMMGTEIRFRSQFEHRSYRTRISKSQHVQGDPLLDCTEYTLENSYYDCLKNEIKETFNNELGCQPPLFTDDLQSMCDEKFKVSRNKSDAISKLFYYLAFNQMKSDCKAPCTQIKYTTRPQIKYPYNFTLLNIIFDRTIDVTQSSFSINEQTLLTKLGGSISMGRTVLWILVSILGANQVYANSLFCFIFSVFEGDEQAPERFVKPDIKSCVASVSTFQNYLKINIFSLLLVLLII